MFFHMEFKITFLFSIFLSPNLWILFSICSILLLAHPVRVFCLFKISVMVLYFSSKISMSFFFLCWKFLLICQIFPSFHSFQEGTCLLKLYWSGSEKEGCLDTAPHLSSAHTPGDGVAEGTWQSPESPWGSSDSNSAEIGPGGSESPVSPLRGLRNYAGGGVGITQ